MRRTIPRWFYRVPVSCDPADGTRAPFLRGGVRQRKPITLTGIVTKVEWTNPHAWVYINREGSATGEVTNWGFEMGPPHDFQRRGCGGYAEDWRVCYVRGVAGKERAQAVNGSKVTMTSTARVGRDAGCASSQGGAVID